MWNLSLLKWSHFLTKIPEKSCLEHYLFCREIPKLLRMKYPVAEENQETSKTSHKQDLCLCPALTGKMQRLRHQEFTLKTLQCN